MTRFRPARCFLLPATLLALSLLASSCATVADRQDAVLREQEPLPAVQEPVSPLRRWQALIEENRSAPTTEKLRSVNLFFNHLPFAEDLEHWGMSDYWATPIETVASGAGDCEDLTIAKFFTLRDMQVAEERLRLTYVLTLPKKTPHMVLTYAAAPQDEPLVLDTGHDLIMPVSKRPDLMPVYSFNTQGVWLAEERRYWAGERLGSVSRLTLWETLLARMGGDPAL